MCGYRKIRFRKTKATATTIAKGAGRRYHLTPSSDGRSVHPYTKPRNCDSGRGRGREAHHDGYQKARRPGEDGDPEVLCHLRRKIVHVGDPAAFAFRHRQSVSERRGVVPESRPTNAPCPVARFQNMPSRNVAKQRRVDEAEDQLQEIHDVVELRGQIRRGDGERTPATVVTRPTVR
jgi:hypothetical protein